MLARFSSVFKQCSVLKQTYQRSFGMSAVACNKLDPVQQVFIDQITKYRKLSGEQGDAAVDAGPEYHQSKQEAVNRIAKLYNVYEPMKFPEFNFKEPDLTQDDADMSRE